jgi:hypothetical protein
MTAPAMATLDMLSLFGSACDNGNDMPVAVEPGIAVGEAEDDVEVAVVDDCELGFHCIDTPFAFNPINRAVVPVSTALSRPRYKNVTKSLFHVDLVHGFIRL